MAATFLPFLYPARIVQRPIRAPVVRQFLRSLHNTTALNSRQKRATRISRDPIPFELPPDLDESILPESKTLGKGEDEDMGTITPMEKQAFDRIFHQMAKKNEHDEVQLRQYQHQHQHQHQNQDAEDQMFKVTTSKTTSRVNALIGEASETSETIARARRRDEVSQRKAAVAAEAEAVRKADKSMERMAMTLDNQRHEVLRKLPRSLRTAASRAMGVKELEEAEGGGTAEKDEDKRRLPVEPIMGEHAALFFQTEAIQKTAAAMQQLREERQRKMEVVMLSRKSDFALWEYMEQHVFALVDELELDRSGKGRSKERQAEQERLMKQKELEQKTKRETKRTRRVGAGLPAAVTAATTATARTSAADMAMQKEMEEKGTKEKEGVEEAWNWEEEEEGGDMEDDAGEQVDPHKADEGLVMVLKLAGKRLSKRRLAEVALKTYGPMYPSLLLHGLKLFARHYDGGQTSPFARAVLPQIKARGLASYVLGASTPFYNELLQLEWARYGNMAAVWALLEEMQRAGLAFDRGTLAVLQSMEFYVLPVFRGNGGGSSSNLGSSSSFTNFSERNSSRDSTDAERNLFVETALRQLPDFQNFPAQLAYWRQQVERGVRLNEPRR